MTVPSGHVGVLWKRFAGGTVLDPRQLKDEGIHLILPWDKLFLYDLRVQSVTETYNAISSDGVSLTATINIRYRLKHDSFHAAPGRSGRITQAARGPEIASQMREVIARYTAEQVYSTKRAGNSGQDPQARGSMLGDKMMEGGESEEPEEDMLLTTSRCMPCSISIDTLILGIELPTAVVTAINRKTEQYYIAEEYKFRVEREKGNRNARRSRPKGSANSSRSSARASPTPICVGAASRRRFSSRSRTIPRS